MMKAIALDRIIGITRFGKPTISSTRIIEAIGVFVVAVCIADMPTTIKAVVSIAGNNKE